MVEAEDEDGATKANLLAAAKKYLKAEAKKKLEKEKKWAINDCTDFISYADYNDDMLLSKKELFDYLNDLVDFGMRTAEETAKINKIFTAAYPKDVAGGMSPA